MKFLKHLVFSTFLVLSLFGLTTQAPLTYASNYAQYATNAQAPDSNPDTTTSPKVNPDTTKDQVKVPPDKDSPSVPSDKDSPSDSQTNDPVKTSTTTTGPVEINLNIFNVKCVFPGVKLPDGKTCFDGDSVLGRVENLLIGLAPSLAVLVMIWGGYLFYNSSVTSQGGERGIKAIQAAVIGLTIVLLAPTVRRIISIATTNGTNNSSTDGRDILKKFAETIVKDLLVPLANIATFAAAAFAVLSIIVGGYNFILGAFESDAEATKKGTAAIRNAVIGLVVIILSISIVSLLQGFISGIQLKTN